MIRVGFVLALLATTASADRDPDAANRAAAEAEAAAKGGDYATAAAKFREAWDHDRLRPELFCNIGIAYYNAHDLVRAHLLLGQCLDQSALDPKVVDNVRAATTSIEGVFRAGGYTPVRIVVDPTATSIAIAELGAGETFVGSHVVWLAFGTYHVSAHAEGYVDAAETVTAQSPDPVTVTFSLDHPKPRDNPPPPPPPLPTLKPLPPPSRMPAIGATAASAVGAAVAVVGYWQGHRRADLAATALDPATLASDKRAVTIWNTALVVGGSVAIIGAAASTYLWYRALHVPTVEIGHGGAVVSWAGRF